MVLGYLYIVSLLLFSAHLSSFHVDADIESALDTVISNDFRTLQEADISLDAIEKALRYKDELSSRIQLVVIKNNIVYSVRGLQISVALAKIRRQYGHLPECAFLYFDGPGPVRPVCAYDGFKPHIFSGNTLEGEENIHFFLDRKTMLKSIYNLEASTREALRTPAWKNRKKQLYWVGDFTDDIVRYRGLVSHEDCQKHLGKDYFSTRLALVRLAKEFPEEIAALFWLNMGNAHGKKIVREENLPCTRERISIRDQLRYAYQIVLDGWTATNPGYTWRLASGACVLKPHSPTKQWFYELLTPWVHYVPVENDLTDLIAKIKWLKKNDRKAMRIGNRGRQWAVRFAREPVFLHFGFRVLERLHALQKREEGALDALIERHGLHTIY